MDLSFALRQRAGVAAATPDLHALLSAAAARQAISPAARAHALRAAVQDAPIDPRILLFSGLASLPAAHPARFADIAEMAVNGRQSS